MSRVTMAEILALANCTSACCSLRSQEPAAPELRVEATAPVRTYERLEGLGDPCPGIPGQPNPPNPGEFEPEGPVIGALDAQMKAVLLSASHIYDAVRSMLKG